MATGSVGSWKGLTSKIRVVEEMVELVKGLSGQGVQ